MWTAALNVLQRNRNALCVYVCVKCEVMDGRWLGCSSQVTLIGSSLRERGSPCAGSHPNDWHHTETGYEL